MKASLAKNFSVIGSNVTVNSAGGALAGQPMRRVIVTPINTSPSPQVLVEGYCIERVLLKAACRGPKKAKNFHSSQH